MRDSLFLLFDQFGLDLITDAATGVWFNFKLIYVSAHLSRKPEKYRTHERFERLWLRHDQRWDAQSEAMRRFLIFLYEPWQLKKSTVEELGCMNEQCPETRHITALQGRTPNTWSTEDWTIFKGWGRNLKVCKGCREAVYCSRTCQKADWGDHRTSCNNSHALIRRE